MNTFDKIYEAFLKEKRLIFIVNAIIWTTIILFGISKNYVSEIYQTINVMFMSYFLLVCFAFLLVFVLAALFIEIYPLLCSKFKNDIFVSLNKDESIINLNTASIIATADHSGIYKFSTTNEWKIVTSNLFQPFSFRIFLPKFQNTIIDCSVNVTVKNNLFAWYFIESYKDTPDGDWRIALKKEIRNAIHVNETKTNSRQIKTVVNDFFPSEHFTTKTTVLFIPNSDLSE